MTVGELVKALKKFDEDAEVVVKGIVDTSEWRSLCPAQLSIISTEIECVDDDGNNGDVGICCQFEETPDADLEFGSNYDNDGDGDDGEHLSSRDDENEQFCCEWMRENDDGDEEDDEF